MSDIKIDFVLTCDQVIASEKGKASIINIFNEIGAKQFPARHPNFCVVVRTTGLPGSYKMKIVLEDVFGNALAWAEGSFSILEDREGKGRNYFLANFSNVVFPSEGKYLLNVSVNDYSDNQIIQSDKNECSIFIKTEK